MPKEPTIQDMEEIGRQLACPSGSAGIEMGETMNRSNQGMTRHSIEFLELADHQQVLELGHGNAGHLPALLEKARGLRYRGLEISETMQREARQKNQSLAHCARFDLYDGENIPFSHHTFDRIFSVNTVYFWQDPVKLLTEISRVLKPQGLLVLGFAQKEFMEQLPFTGAPFKLYNADDVLALTKGLPLAKPVVQNHNEKVQSKAGEWVERPYSLIKWENA
ncbi:MAG: class I SAM-dependent methyltransferase [Owenweeksia sp.]|nr:class I SAM-dependent methyltransferase [Owenweeksia sp.]